MAALRRSELVLSPALVLLAALCLLWLPALAHEFKADGSVLELDESSFDSAISSFDYILVDFYAPWCGHCKRLAPELDAAAPILYGLREPIRVAKIDADKHRKLAAKYDIDGFPTLKIFSHGVPLEYNGPRKADLLIRFLKKFVAPNVSLLESDSAICEFVESAGTDFPIFIGFGLDESLITEFGSKYKKKAWFSVAKDFSENIMVQYDFDKVPALVYVHPAYNEQSVFYGPFEEKFLEEFVLQNQLPLVVPINHDTLKLLNDDKRKIVLAIMEDHSDETGVKVIKTLRAAATANRDLVFAYVSFNQWEEFIETFEVSKNYKLPRLLVWDGNEEYHLVEGSESLEVGEDIGSQVSRFLQGYREGKIISKRISGPSFLGFFSSLVSTRTVYLVIFVAAVLVLGQTLFGGGQGSQQAPAGRRAPALREEDAARPAGSEGEGSRVDYQPGQKED